LSAKFFRKSQVAERYSVSPRSVDRWARDGRLPKPHYRGRLPLWRESELEQLERRAVVTARKEPA
jgi:predicted DNA-binding transcriptional regulator AlpA